jgi:hypothetical protein
MRYVILLVALSGLLYLLLSSIAAARERRRGDWRVETVPRPDGSLAVLLVQTRSAHARVIREVPADLDSLDTASELRLGREEAQLQADELNRITPSPSRRRPWG